MIRLAISAAAFEAIAATLPLGSVGFELQLGWWSDTNSPASLGDLRYINAVPCLMCDSNVVRAETRLTASSEADAEPSEAPREVVALAPLLSHSGPPPGVQAAARAVRNLSPPPPSETTACAPCAARARATATSS